MLSLGIDIGGTRIKAALVRGSDCIARSCSERYRNPVRQELLAAVSECAVTLQCQDEIEAVGICAPGMLSDDRTRVIYSTNLPALQEIALQDVASALVGGFGAIAPSRVMPPIVTDQIAAATDYAVMRQLRGRLLSVSIGTGVGAAVLDVDDAHPLGLTLRASGDSPGHIGQMDVSLDDDPPVGADGGAGSLEAYIGAAALRGREPMSLGLNDAPVRALVRALRICHAIYRPDEIALLGGVGTRLRHLGDELRQRVNARLSRIARHGWKLGFGEDDFHAARGAARLAAVSFAATNDHGPRR